MRPLRLKKDPAPSRWAYRWERLWLTPMFRRAVRVGLPFAVAFMAGTLYLGNEDNQQAIVDKYAEIRRSVEERPEFMVKLMAIDGASPELNSAIREVMPVELPLSSFDLDLEAMQEQVESLDAIKKVDIRVKSGGLLQINVEERVPAIIWRGPQGLELLDEGGHRVQGLDARATRADLPVIAGEGAHMAVGEALDLIARASPIQDKLVGLVRISERRWDLALKDDQRIMLPPENPGRALDRVLGLHEAQDLLGRDVTHVDIRNPDRPTLRLSEGAMTALRDMRDAEIRPANKRE